MEWGPKGPAAKPLLRVVARSLAAAFVCWWLFASSPAFAGFQFKKGSFAKNAAVGAQPVTGVGFQPKAVVFFWTRQTAVDTFNPDISSGYGFATGPANERAIAIASQDGSLGGNTGKGQWQSSSIVLFSSPTPTVGAQAELISLDGDGFTLNWTVNEARADIIHYIALGGSDIKNAKVDSFVKATGTGNLPVTGVGFKPDFVMFLAAHTTGLDFALTDAQVGLGFAAGPTERAAVSVSLEDNEGLARDTCSWQRADRVLLELSDFCAADTEFDFVSFDADGFTVNRILNNNDTRLVHYLALQGGEYKVGSFNKSTSPAPVDQAVTGVAFPPVGLMLASKNRVTNAADEIDGRISFGVGDGTTEGATWWHDLIAITADNAQRTSVSKIAVHATQPGTLDAEADLKSFDPDGFTLTWTTNNTVAHEIIYVAFGEPTTSYRSIGIAPDYTSGAVAATNGSVVVTGSGTAWRTANRGRGDRIRIDTADYTIDHVISNTQLELTKPFTGFTGTGKPYVISRQYTTLQAWEDCISGVPAACTFFPVASSNLVADDRREVGIAYKDSIFTSALTIEGSTTDALHDITLTAIPGNRHYGIAGAGVVLDIGSFSGPAIRVNDDFVTMEWLELQGGQGAGAHGILIDQLAANNKLVIRDNLIHNMPGDGLQFEDSDTNVDLYNNIIHTVNRGILFNASPAQAGIFNNTIYGCMTQGMFSSGGGLNITLQNNISYGNILLDFAVASPNLASDNNLSSDDTAPGTNSLVNVPLAWVNFVSTTPGSEDLHIKPGSVAENAGIDLGPIVSFDIDAAARISPWDIGADEVAAVTAVELASFTATAGESSVLLEWETGSEVDNLGFHLYRANSPDGPREKINSALIPGLGSSPEGARYRYLDRGVTNGRTYFYWLEDVESTWRTELHGPVSATPSEGASTPESDSTALLTYGEPSGHSLRVLSRGRQEVVLELTTSGFFAEPEEDGTVTLRIPGFLEEEGALGIPVKRVSLDAPAGRGVRIVSVEAKDVLSFASLKPSFAELEVAADTRGVVRLARVRSRGATSESSWARLVSVGFQGESKKAVVELAPLRWESASGKLLLARRLTVRVSFNGRDRTERSLDGHRGRRYRERASHRERRGGVARLATVERGVYRVTYQEVFGREPRQIAVSSLRLSRQGKAVAFHVEPQRSLFAPGSTLYFVSGGAELNPYGNEAVYELEWGESGETMAVTRGAPSSKSISYYQQQLQREENRIYLAAFVRASDPWLWDSISSQQTKAYSFITSSVAPVSGSAQLEVWLQGATDAPSSPDHQVRVYVNGALVGEGSWDGKEAQKINGEIPNGLLREGENTLSIENAGELSMVYLDRFALSYGRETRAESGRLEGIWSDSGVAEIRGLGAGAVVLDLTEESPVWLQAGSHSIGNLRIPVEAGHHYLAVGPEAILRPEVRKPTPTRLKSTSNRADYLAIGPAEFLEVAEPLLTFRRSQGLRVKTVSTEAIDSEFGFGESGPDAIRDFLAYAYHHWRNPSPRYVLLLGDATYDFKNYLGTGMKNRVPPLMLKTDYLWLPSDPTYAAVNGEDGLPDLAIGRLPAATTEELRALVEKVLAYETGPSGSPARAVLVADNPDVAGNFTADAEDIATQMASSLALRKIYLEELGTSTTRAAILDAFDQGAFLMSYLGHGGVHVWASENIFNRSQVGSLGLQSQQPLLLTLNCLNGYFHIPNVNSLSEELLKAEGKGAIAAFSPSGLSLNSAAHLYHQALVRELFSGSHPRLGDAIVSAQAAYADTGAFPELLRIYHLLGDPALTLKLRE